MQASWNQQYFPFQNISEQYSDSLATFGSRTGADDIYGCSSSWGQRRCPASQSHHVLSHFTCSAGWGRQLKPRLQQDEISSLAASLYQSPEKVRISPVFGTWYKVTTSVVVSQLRVLNCCGLLKVFEICVQILIKVTTFRIKRNLSKL